MYTVDLPHHFERVDLLIISKILTLKVNILGENKRCYYSLIVFNPKFDRCFTGVSRCEIIDNPSN